jgi:hypothetical protein
MVSKKAGPLCRKAKDETVTTDAQWKFLRKKEKKMRKMSGLIFLVLAAAAMLAACSGIPTAATPNAATSIAATIQVLVPPTATPDIIAEGVQTTIQAMTPSASAVTEEAVVETQAATPEPTNTIVPTTQVELLQLKTAEDVREFFSSIEGWVSGGDAGQWTAGAQGVLAKDLILRNMPEGMIFEFECVQYSTFSGRIQTKKVCADATVRFSEVIPAGSFGTLWLEWAVQGSEESWEEGFVNKPCICADGDCRDL